jgi:hypothetical protein
MGAHLLSVRLGHVWEGRLTSRALPTTLYVVTHCAQPVLAMVTEVSKLDEMLLASCDILSQPFFDCINFLFNYYRRMMMMSFICSCRNKK